MSRRTDPIARPTTTPAARVGSRVTSYLVLLAVAGIVARLVLALVSYGTNDYRFYRMFARYVLMEGLHALYTEVPEFNHTPLTTAYFVGVHLFAETTGLSFALLFKLPIIAADAGSAVLLWRIWRRRGGGGGGAAGYNIMPALAAALFGWSLCSMLVTGYHCNTDSLFAFFALLAVYLVEERGRPFAAGLALAVAINIKLIPVLLVPALLMTARRRDELLRVLGALALGAVPFVVMLLVYGRLFYEKVIAYNSFPTKWGASFFLLVAAERPGWDEALRPAIEAYRTWGKWVMLGAIIVAAAVARRRGWDRYRAAAVAMSLFLMLAPGFGIQYSVAVAPLLFAVSVRFGAVYSTLAGVHLLTLYVMFSKGTFPWETFFTGADPTGPAVLGLLAWGTLVVFVVRELARGDARPDTDMRPMLRATA